MLRMEVLLDSVEKVKDFVDAVSEFDEDFDLLSGRYVVDAKSIMGVLSLDLGKPVGLHVFTEELTPDMEKALSPFLAE